MQLPDVIVEKSYEVIAKSMAYLKKTRSPTFVLDDDIAYNINNSTVDYNQNVEDITLMQTYTAVMPVYRGASAIAEAGATVPLKIWKKDENQIRVECTEHPANAILDRPNKLMNRHRLMMSAIGFPILVGQGFWFLERPNFLQTLDSHIRRIHVVRPDFVDVKSKHNTENRVFKRQDVLSRDYEDHEVVHFKNWNPMSAFHGLPTILAGQNTMILEIYLEQFAKTFFSNAVIPSMIFGTEKNIGEVGVERFKAEVRQVYTGIPNMHKMMVLYNGLKPIDHRIPSPADSAYVDSTELVMQRIFMNLGCYDLMAIEKGLSGEGLDVARKMFWEKTMQPILKNTQQTITNELLSQYDDKRWDGCFAEFDTTQVSALKDEFRDMSLGVFRLIQAGVLGKKEARVMLGYPREMAEDDETTIAMPRQEGALMPPSSRTVSNEEREFVEEMLAEKQLKRLQKWLETDSRITEI